MTGQSDITMAAECVEKKEIADKAPDARLHAALEAFALATDPPVVGRQQPALLPLNVHPITVASSLRMETSCQKYNGSGRLHCVRGMAHAAFNNLSAFPTMSRACSPGNRTRRAERKGSMPVRSLGCTLLNQAHALKMCSVAEACASCRQPAPYNRELPRFDSIDWQAIAC